MEIKQQVKKEAKLHNLPFVEALNEKEISAIRGGVGAELNGEVNASSEELNELLRQSPFGRLSEVLGDDLSSIFNGLGGGNSSENPFG